MVPIVFRPGVLLGNDHEKSCTNDANVKQHQDPIRQHEPSYADNESDGEEAKCHLQSNSAMDLFSRWTRRSHTER